MDDITALLMEKNKEVAEMAKKVMKKLKEEVDKKGFKFSVTENGKEGKSKMIASCGFLEDDLRQCSKEEGVTMEDSVETLGMDSGKRVKRLGAKEKSRRKKCKVTFFDHQEEQGLPKELHEDGGQEVVTSGYGVSEDVESACSGFSPFRKIEIEEAAGSSNGQKEYILAALFLEAYDLEVEEDLSTLATQY